MSPTIPSATAISWKLVLVTQVDLDVEVRRGFKANELFDEVVVVAAAHDLELIIHRCVLWHPEPKCQSTVRKDLNSHDVLYRDRLARPKRPPVKGGLTVVQFEFGEVDWTPKLMRQYGQDHRAHDHTG